MRHLTERDGQVVSLASDVVYPAVGVDQGIGGHRVDAETDREGVGCVLDVTVARLLPDTDGVVLVGEMLSSSKVVALESSRHSSEPLAAP